MRHRLHDPVSKDDNVRLAPAARFVRRDDLVINALRHIGQGAVALQISVHTDDRDAVRMLLQRLVGPSDRLWCVL